MSPKPRDYPVTNTNTCPHRLAASHAGLRIGFTLVTLAVRMLPKSHPTRIFILGRIAMIRPGVMRSVTGDWHRAGTTTIGLAIVAVVCALIWLEPFAKLHRAVSFN